MIDNSSTQLRFVYFTSMVFLKTMTKTQFFRSFQTVEVPATVGAGDGDGGKSKLRT
jgi:hypothetical protein